MHLRFHQIQVCNNFYENILQFLFVFSRSTPIKPIKLLHSLHMPEQICGLRPSRIACFILSLSRLSIEQILHSIKFCEKSVGKYFWTLYNIIVIFI